VIVIVDYNLGNLGSIKNMIHRNGFDSVITSDPDVVLKASRLILPGVGSFDHAILNLKELGLFEVVKKIAESGVPTLGICLGMQILADGSEEGVETGLGLVPGKVKKFSLSPSFKIPHMGWNFAKPYTDNSLFTDLEIDSRFYFVHSYYFECLNQENVLAKTNYDGEFTSAVSKKNIFGVQFHPEKSHLYGMKLLKNFIELENVKD
jgi:imidazole glycerol-phosphate synthase subunit HisH